MGVRTRSATSSPVKKSVSITRIVADHTETPRDPPTILIAPTSISADSRFLLLKRPGDESLRRFLFCPQQGLFEITKIESPAGALQSILFTPSGDRKFESTKDAPKAGISDGYVSKKADILTATPFDITYLLLPFLAPEHNASKKAMFQPLDDILEVPVSEQKHLGHITCNGRHLVEAAMLNICDTLDAGDEKMFRYSEDKVMQFWLQRAQQVVKQGLPPSMEEKFVTRVLEAPILSVMREEIVTTSTTTDRKDTDSSGKPLDAQSMTEASEVSATFSETLITSTVTTVEDIRSPDVHELQRLKTALQFISATCLPRSLADRLQERLDSPESPVNFGPLTSELQRVSAMRAEALARRSISDFSRKRLNFDGEEAAELRAEKKRKLEEDEKKRKANESRGVRDLKKVNVSGMKKMSHFFMKKPAVATKT